MRSFIIFSLLAIAGCNDETADGVRHNYVDRHSDAFVYEGTTHEHVLAAVRSVLADGGYELVPGESPDVFTTTNHAAAKKHSDEYVVHVVDLRWRRGFLVQLVKVTRDSDGLVTSSGRDDKLEWEIIQRADPDRAVDIMAKANEKADKVPARVHANPTAK